MENAFETIVLITIGALLIAGTILKALVGFEPAAVCGITALCMIFACMTVYYVKEKGES